MELVKSIKVDNECTLKLERTSSTWFITMYGTYEDGTTWHNAYHAVDTERKAMNRLRKICKCLNIDF